MTSIKILINNIIDISNFVHQMSNSVHTIHVRSGRYIIDAKSIMGLYSLDLSKPVIVESDEILEDKILSFLKKFECK